MDNDLVLEQYLSPASPLLVGFRLDAFTAIKPRVTHSPSSDIHSKETSVTFLEDRHVSPAVLYIQVSYLQVFTALLFQVAARLAWIILCSSFALHSGCEHVVLHSS